MGFIWDLNGTIVGYNPLSKLIIVLPTLTH